MAASPTTLPPSTVSVLFPAQSIQVYENVCHHLCISARTDVRALLQPSNISRRTFSTQSLSIPDEHIIALCCALLVRSGVTPRLVALFLSHTSPTLPPHRRYFPHPFPQTPNFPEVARTGPLKRARASPSAIWDFSNNPSLSPSGASTILAACLLIPAPAYVEVDLQRCTTLTSLTLRSWLPFLETERKDGSRFAVLSGLCLDSCPLRSLDLETMRALPSLRWISLRYTAVSNLWRCTDMLRCWSHLVAALFRGASSDEADREQLYQMRRFCQRALLAHDRPLTPPSSHSTANSSTPLPAFTPTVLGRHNQAHPDFQHDPDIDKAYPFSPQNSPQFVGNTLNTNQSDGKRPTPVSLAPGFFDFILANAPTTLKLLDGVSISAQRRNEALRTVDKHFEPIRRPPDLAHHFSMMSLLRHREDGFSRPMPRTTRDPNPLPDNPNNKLKRRRTEEYLPGEANVTAGVTAAGFTTFELPARLGPSANVTVSLAAASSTSDASRHRCDTSIGRVRDEVFGEREDSMESLNPPSPMSTQSQANTDHRSRRKVLRDGLGTFCGESFERSVSSSLIRRPGAPRIRYLNHEGDRPRQFEYNPERPSELVYGTENGYMVVLDQETGEVRGSCMAGGGRGNHPAGQIIPQTSDLNSMTNLPSTRASRQRARAAPVYGLSWLHNEKDRFLAGTDDGAIHVYDVNEMGRDDRGGCMYACETFQRLTSLHVSCDDISFAVSGQQPHVGLFDLETGRRKEMMRGCHTQAINVIKFAHRSPHVLVTSSFDQFVKKWDLRESRPGGGRRPIFQARSRTDNVMACFSPDDSRLLVSAVDNEVTQYSAIDGRLELEFNIPKTGSSNNFTRSYYMNNRDYIITGSCNENVVRVYNARTGAFFTEVDMDNRETVEHRSLYVQSLRANPGRRFSFSALLASSTTHGLIASTDLHCR